MALSNGLRAGVFAAAMVAACAGVANAGIASTSATVQVVAPPPSALPNAFTFPAGTPRVRTWLEQSDFQLASTLNTNASAAGLYNEVSDLTNSSVVSGTRIASYYVHFDSPASSEASISGSITFDEQILGVIVIGDGGATAQLLDASDFLGAPGTIYPTGLTNRGMELSPNGDRFRISADLRTVEFNFSIGNPGDYIRVVTAAIPSPGAGGLMALAALGASRRRRGV